MFELFFLFAVGFTGVCGQEQESYVVTKHLANPRAVNYCPQPFRRSSPSHRLTDVDFAARARAYLLMVYANRIVEIMDETFVPQELPGEHITGGESTASYIERIRGRVEACSKFLESADWLDREEVTGAWVNLFSLHYSLTKLQLAFACMERAKTVRPPVLFEETDPCDDAFVGWKYLRALVKSPLAVSELLIWCDSQIELALFQYHYDHALLHTDIACEFAEQYLGLADDLPIKLGSVRNSMSSRGAARMHSLPSPDTSFKLAEPEVELVATPAAGLEGLSPLAGAILFIMFLVLTYAIIKAHSGVDGSV